LISDNKILGVQRVRLSIERKKFFAVAREPNVDTAF
jgi:hypothetical protein